MESLHVNAKDQEVEKKEQRQKMIAKIIDPSTWPLFEIKAFILPNNQKYLYCRPRPYGLRRHALSLHNSRRRPACK